ncbi:hypothetical protein, partial [Pantoea sp. UBA7232]|uniref:hypothetical protein n=1 Tax=Pantoea sp. UBA7232 TaxID=1947045 RepID=UPI0025974958
IPRIYLESNAYINPDFPAIAGRNYKKNCIFFAQYSLTVSWFFLRFQHRIPSQAKALLTGKFLADRMT